MTADYALWNVLISVATLVVVAVAAVAAVRQLRHLRAQTSLAALLKVLEDWRDPEFRSLIGYVRREIPPKLAEPGFLDDFDQPSVDRTKHPELEVCDWYEQLGCYIKRGLFDEGTFMDVASSSTNGVYAALEPIILRMRETRGDSLYENFEYLAARGVLFQRKHPKGCYPRGTPRMAELGGAVVHDRRARPAAARESTSAG